MIAIVLVLVLVLAEAMVRSPRKLHICTIENNIYRIRVSQTIVNLIVIAMYLSSPYDI